MFFHVCSNVFLVVTQAQARKVFSTTRKACAYGIDQVIRLPLHALYGRLLAPDKQPVDVEVTVLNDVLIFLTMDQLQPPFHHNEPPPGKVTQTILAKSSQRSCSHPFVCVK